MKSLNEAIRIVREWIIRTIFREVVESRGPVQITATPMPSDPIGPPLRCAYELEQVDLIGQETAAILARLQAAVEALKTCEDTTLQSSLETTLLHSESMDAIRYMQSASVTVMRLVRARRPAKK